MWMVKTTIHRFRLFNKTIKVVIEIKPLQFGTVNRGHDSHRLLFPCNKSIPQKTRSWVGRRRLDSSLGQIVEMKSGACRSNAQGKERLRQDGACGIGAGC